jgi:hypothetical protein
MTQFYLTCQIFIGFLLICILTNLARNMCFSNLSAFSAEPRIIYRIFYFRQTIFVVSLCLFRLAYPYKVQAERFQQSLKLYIGFKRLCKRIFKHLVYKHFADKHSRIAAKAMPYVTLAIGKLRMRTPFRANIAFVTAGARGGNAGSPTPVGARLLAMM